MAAVAAAIGLASARLAPGRAAPAVPPAVEGYGFESRAIYHSRQTPGYTSWVSFFPGERGQWYVTCEEVTRVRPPLPRSPRERWFEMSLPVGYDKSQYRMELVILESGDGLRTWKPISRTPVRFQHSAGSFAQARTRDGRFLRFSWSCYSLDPSLPVNEILSESRDNGRTWKRLPPFHDPHFASFPHRLRTLRDGTLVLALPLTPRWGSDSDRPVRASMQLDAPNDMQMNLCFSFDQGRSWSPLLPVFGGQNVSETDFVELPDGNLLLFNNQLFAHPGRQLLYRRGRRFTPGPLERVRTGEVPETVCLTRDGILVGCMRPGTFRWSDDLGRTWQPLSGVPSGGELYQPWIQALPDGRIACAGHLGGDDPIGTRDQHVTLQLFRLRINRKTRSTRLRVSREFDAERDRYPNRYEVTLTSDGRPLPGKEVELWYASRGEAAYDSWNSRPLEDRMRAGGRRLTARSGPDGVARFLLPEMETVQDRHFSYQLIARFNPERADPDYQPAQTPQLEFYALSYQDPPLR